jgi:hypothetical protein
VYSGVLRRVLRAHFCRKTYPAFTRLQIGYVVHLENSEDVTKSEAIPVTTSSGEDPLLGVKLVLKKPDRGAMTFSLIQKNLSLLLLERGPEQKFVAVNSFFTLKVLSVVQELKFAVRAVSQPCPNLASWVSIPSNFLSKSSWDPDSLRLHLEVLPSFLASCRTRQIAPAYGVALGGSSPCPCILLFTSANTHCAKRWLECIPDGHAKIHP